MNVSDFHWALRRFSLEKASHLKVVVAYFDEDVPITDSNFR